MRSLVLVALVALAACASNPNEIVASTTTPPAVTSSTTSSVPTTTTVAATTTTVALLDRILAAPADEVEHAFPIGVGVNASYARTHGEYPATDVFADCGTEVRAMATGVVQHVRRADDYDKKTDNPALRGGKSVSIIGLDGVRYYTSHLDRIDVTVGQAVTAGDVLGTIGLTGDSTACHTHVGISPLCPSIEWSVRRGVIWPWAYLDAWRKGLQKSPVAEIRTWSAGHADACANAAADPNAAD
jgi:peptidoglycan LD-endopeptidase LytH